MSTRNEFAISKITAGQLNAVVKRMMTLTGITDPIEAVRQFNAGDWTIVPSSERAWYQGNMVLHTEVLSNGHQASKHISLLESAGFTVSKNARSIMTEYTLEFERHLIAVAIYPSRYFQPEYRQIDTITNRAITDGYKNPSIETSWLLRQKLTDQNIREMGLKEIIVMHQPIVVNDDPSVRWYLTLSREKSGNLLYLRPTPARESSSSENLDEGVGLAFMSQLEEI